MRQQVVLNMTKNMKKNRHYFASAFTGRGYLSFWADHFQELKRLYLLQGNTPGGHSLVLRSLGLALTDRGYRVNYYHRAEDHLMVEGLTVPSLGFGVMSGHHPYAVQKFFPVHLETVIMELPGRAVPDNVNTIFERVLKIVKSAREVYQSGTRTSDKAAEQWDAKFWIEEFQEKPSNLRHYFAGSVSGGLNLSGDFFECCKKRYLIKGSLGSGTSVMRDILVDALSRRYIVEAYHSIIEPSDLVVLYIPEVQVAVINGTCCYHDLAQLSGDTVWYLGKGLQVPTCSGTSYEEIKLKLVAAGRELDQYHKKLEKGEVYLTAEEIDAIVSRIIRETAS